ncbi:rhodanese-like domain-containing protein [Vibrio parahaemolyticus]|uniref:rhodanese-like domain-containing protein n=1 Tax=Vibrio TaxID=662 RepID=UPI00193D2B72|nr:MULTISPECIES: rhodanese-like domain-containing protein [Vibrio]MCA2496473.1 rhodanese-like domain-containing protein [Vibrio alginolyticus]MCF9039728.1 rhodanese-like domain-containing protein [Vibrio parahaemolyticus]MDW2219042.1 rhodanese-like domain-containing protein [Vibrio sp. 2175-1]
MDELPQDNETEIICYCKISLRGYEAQLVRSAYGWKNVKVMEGGVMAWPYTRGKIAQSSTKLQTQSQVI